MNEDCCCTEDYECPYHPEEEEEPFFCKNLCYCIVGCNCGDEE